MGIVWTDLAVNSLADILSYIQRFFGKRVARTVSNNIITFVSSLEENPQIGKLLTHLSSYGEIRCVFYKQNHIYYRILEDRIEIIIVWDGRQNPSHLQTLLINFLTK